MPSQKYDLNNSLRIIFIKIIIKINIIKIYMTNTHFITRKSNITRIFIKVEYIFISVPSSKKFFNHFTCNKQSEISCNTARESSTVLSHSIDRNRLKFKTIFLYIHPRFSRTEFSNKLIVSDLLML